MRTNAGRNHSNWQVSIEDGCFKCESTLNHMAIQRVSICVKEIGIPMTTVTCGEKTFYSTVKELKCKHFPFLTDIQSQSTRECLTAFVNGGLN